jgi:hypothetical protein
MFNFLGGLFIVLHGLVHLWYLVLSLKLVAFKPEMGWTGKSWLLTGIIGESATRTSASLFYILSAIGVVLGGVGVIIGGNWWRPLMISSLVLSSLTLLIFWDGLMDKIVQKGLIGIVINGVILITTAAL